MKRKIYCFVNILLIFSLGVFSIAAQAKKKTRVKPKKIYIVDKFYLEPKPEITNFAFVINLDKDSNVKLTIQKNENAESLTNTGNIKPLTDFFSAFELPQNSPTKNKPKDLPGQIIIVKADPSLKYSEVISVIQASRISNTQKIFVETSKDFYAVVVPLLEKREYTVPKPNPQTLVVTLDQNMNLTLNNEDSGSLNDSSLLTNRLMEIFNDRKNNGVLREGTNDVETTVFVKAQLSVKFADVIRIVDVLKKAGASPVGLQVDDLEQ